MSKVIGFVKDSYYEITQKVHWPKYFELQNKAVLVLIASLIFALVIGLIDAGFENLMKLIYNS